MDAISLIKTDHRAIRRLFTQFDGLEASDQAGQEAVVKELVQLLHNHAAVEEDIFYPEVAKAEAEPTEQMQDSSDEHEHIDQMVDELANMSCKDPSYRDRFAALKRTMMQHMREEEHDVLPAAQKAMDESKLDKLGDTMTRERKSAESRQLH